MARVGISVSFTAIRSTRRALNTKKMTKALDDYTYGFVREVVEYLSEYPEVDDTDYVRTLTLLKSWKIVKTRSFGANIGYRFENYARDYRGKYYARLVHGGPRGDGQYWLHAANGWIRTDEAVDEIGGREGFRSGAQGVINRILRAA